MPFFRAWLLPRISFWIVWTAWLCLIRSLPHPSLLLIIGPPVAATWLGSRFANSSLETSWSLFWKGAAASCLLSLFADIYLLDDIGIGPMLLLPAFAAAAYLGLHSGGVKTTSVTSGELFDRVQSTAALLRVRVGRLIVFTSPRNIPNAYANRMGAILISERLLAILSRRETDAVIAHEAAHLRPRQRYIVSLLPVIAGALFFFTALWPQSKVTAPFWPITGLFLWRALRRSMEYDADLASTRSTGDAESLITALTRVSLALGMPLRWSGLAGIFVAHPPMTARFRAIARRAGIPQTRVDELITAASQEAPEAGYPSPAGQPDTWGALAPHLARVQKRMHLLNLAYPVLAGALFAALNPDASLLAFVAWTLAAIVIYCIAYETIAGVERRRFRNELPGPAAPGAYFAGLSTAAEPRVFANSYHYDLGTLSMSPGSLQFRGARCFFMLAPSQVRRTWLAPGPPHWSPRKIVCIEYQLDESSAPGVISFQSLERWFWPGTTQAARQLLDAVRQWTASPPQQTDAAPSAPPPRDAGAPVPGIPLSAIWKPVGRSCVLSIAASTLLMAPSAWLTAAAVTAALNLFILAPHLNRARLARPVLAPSR